MSSPREHVVGDVRVITDVEMPMRDGVVLRSDVYRPADASGPLPVLLLRTPYDRREAHAGSYAHPGWYTRRGFAVVHQDCRGRFGSDGEFHPFADEGRDGRDTIGWLAAQPWSDGRVAMYGSSYSGLVQLLAAAERPPELVAIAPAMTSPWVAEEWLTRAGAFHQGFVPWWAALLACDERRRNGDRRGVARLRRLLACPCKLRSSTAAELREHIASRIYDELLGLATDPGALPDPEGVLDSIHVPVLHIGGLFDVFVRGTVAAHRRISARRDDQVLLIGPWQHSPWAPRAGELEFQADAAAPQRIDGEQIDFFRSVLSGKPRASTVRWLPVGGPKWIESPGWTPADASAVLHLDSDGDAGSAYGSGRMTSSPPGRGHAPDLFAHVPGQPLWASGGHSCCRENVAGMGATDQRELEERRGALVYESPPATDGALVAGHAAAHLSVSSTAAKVRLQCRLHLVRETCSFNLAEGVRDATVPPGRAAVVAIDVGPFAIRVAPGDRLRLVVTGPLAPNVAAHPQTEGIRDLDVDPVDGVGATHAVHHDADHPSRLILTTIEGSIPWV
jgi:uncharacterized protein